MDNELMITDATEETTNSDYKVAGIGAIAGIGATLLTGFGVRAFKKYRRRKAELEGSTVDVGLNEESIKPTNE